MGEADAWDIFTFHVPQSFNYNYKKGIFWIFIYLFVFESFVILRTVEASIAISSNYFLFPPARTEPLKVLPKLPYLNILSVFKTVSSN